MELIIKSSNVTCGDLVLQCGSGWKVFDIKLQLHGIHPVKPEPPKQKLIFSGQLLDDGQLIEDIVKSSAVQGTPILHLVCHMSSITIEEAATSQSTFYTMSSSTGGLQQNSLSTLDTENSQPSQSSFRNNVPESHLLAQQMAWWQQAYTEHYRNQYAQYLSSMGYYRQHQVLGSAVTTAQSVSAEAPAVAPPAEEPRAVPGQPPVGQVDEADDDLDPARDWLDWVYIGTRLALLLAIVFYYSSLSRVLMVVFIVLAVYIYQHDYAQPMQRVQREVNNNINEATPIEQEIGTNQEEVRNPEDAVLRPINPSTFSVAINMLTGFFASLIPEVPEAL